MNVLSLFDGIGTGKLMLDMAGIKVDKYYASEIDENAISICKKNYPEVIEIGDVEKINLEDLGKIDLLIGGSPCQGFSRNGKMLNFNDNRSKLFFTFIKIWKKIKELNPNAKFILENVRMKKEWQDTITEIMEVEPIIIDSRIHSGGTRERTYWQNINNKIKQPKEEKEDLLDLLEKVSTENYINKDEILFDPKISEQERNIVSVVNGEVRIKQATKLGYIVAENGDGINLSFPMSKTRRGRVIKRKCPTLDCQCNVCVYYNGIIRKLTITEIERVQHLPDGYTEGLNEANRKKAIGNGWNAKTLSYIANQLNND